MKKIFTIIFALISLSAIAQKKSVAVLTPLCKDQSVNDFYQQVVRGAMEDAISKSDEYITYDRAAFDKVIEEHNFQSSGVVNDKQIRQLGDYAGVDFVFVTEVKAYDGYINVIAKVINITSGQASTTISKSFEQTVPLVESTCKQIAAQVLRIIDVKTGARTGELQLAEGKYVGEIMHGKPHGKGTLYYTDGKKYVGDWNDGVRNGYGIFTTPDNSVRYEGYWVNNTFHGQGKLIYLDGRKYIGNIENGKASGHGVFYYPNGNKYDGSFANDVYNGQGTMYDANGKIKYVGSWKNGKKSGQGKFYFSNGESYEGSFADDNINGYGTMYRANGKIKYVGSWENGVKSGQGKFYYSDGDRYEGSFADDEINGYGTFYFSNGDRVKVYWKDGEENGKGVYYFEGGEYLEGTWVNGHLSGPAKYVKNYSEWLEGNYVNGKREGEWIYYYWDGRQKKKKLIYSNGKIISGGF